MALSSSQLGQIIRAIRRNLSGRLGRIVIAMMGSSRIKANGQKAVGDLLRAVGLPDSWSTNWRQILDSLDSLLQPETRPTALSGKPKPPPGAPPLPGEDTGMTKPIRTTASSNVFSFWFEPDSNRRTGTLYVCFQAPALDHHNVKFSKENRTLTGKLGSTIKGKHSDKAGPVYAYWGPKITTKLYNDMVNYAQGTGGHAGKWVWDNLRMRGSKWAHMPGVSYRLYQGSIGFGTGGIYVPRKATREGFKSRAATDVGTGRRGFVRSALPSQLGHSTFRRRIG